MKASKWCIIYKSSPLSFIPVNNIPLDAAMLDFVKIEVPLV